MRSKGEECSAFRCTYNLRGIYSVTNFSICYSMNITVVPLFFRGKHWQERARKRVPVISTIFYISYRTVIPRNSRRRDRVRKSRRLQNSKRYRSTSNFALLRPYAYTHTHTYIYSNRPFSFSTYFFLCALCITPLRTASRAITVD